MKQMNSQTIIDFLKSHELISIHGLEKKLGLSNGTISKAVDGRRGLPEKYHEKIISELKKYGILMK